MKLKASPIKDRQRQLFSIELSKRINPSHPMIKLAKATDWDRLDEVFGKTYCPNKGRPGISTRLNYTTHL